MESPFDGSGSKPPGHDSGEMTWTCRAARDDEGGLVWLPRLIVDGHDVAAAVLGSVIARQPVETFMLACLSERMRLLTCLRMSQRDLFESIVSAPDRFVHSIATSDTRGLLLVHNHPSGDPSPTEDDYLMTTALALVAAEVGLATHDHLIVVQDGRYYSFKTRRVHGGDQKGA